MTAGNRFPQPEKGILPWRCNQLKETCVLLQTGITTEDGQKPPGKAECVMQSVQQAAEIILSAPICNLIVPSYRTKKQNARKNAPHSCHRLMHRIPPRSASLTVPRPRRQFRFSRSFQPPSAGERDGKTGGYVTLPRVLFSCQLEIHGIADRNNAAVVIDRLFDP